LRHVSVQAGSGLCGGCPFFWSPCWCRSVERIVKAVSFGIYVQRGTYFITLLNFKSFIFFIFQSVKWKPPNLWLPLIKRLQG